MRSLRAWRSALTGALILVLSGCASLDGVQPMPPMPAALREEISNQPPPAACGASISGADFGRAYPPGALDAGVQGWVVLHIEVAIDGHLISVEPVQAAPEGVFEDAAVGLVSHIQFPAQDKVCGRLMVIQFRQAW